MSKERASIKVRLAIGYAAIAVMLIISGIAAFSIQQDAALTAAKLAEHNEADKAMLTLRTDIAQSMFPVHDYLIEGILGDREAEFSKMTAAIRRGMKHLAATEDRDHPEQALIDGAIERLDKLVSIQRRIFALKGEGIQNEGPAMVYKIHEFQNAILDNFDEFRLAEQTELEKLDSRG